MENYLNEFLQSLESHNTQKVVRNLLQKMDIENIDLQNIRDEMQVRNLILKSNPNSEKAVTTTMYALKNYASWLNEKGVIGNDIENIIRRIKRKDLWELAKANATPKFISHQDFLNCVQEIGLVEDYNGGYYETLFRAIYEGIYSDDGLSVIKNLRRSDIDLENSTVVLHKDDGQEYKLKISARLADDLYGLSEIDTWERANSKGLCKIQMIGLYHDSCFKKELRSSANDSSWQHTYYSKIRKLTKDYFDRNIKPLEIYVSGIMYRLKESFDRHGISLEEAFAKDGKNKQVTQIIETELIRSNYNYTVGAFREMVQGYLDVFER